MLKNILAVFAGIIVGSICIWGVETLNHLLHPFPKGIKPDDMEGFKNYIETLPFLGKFMVIVGYALGAVVSGFIATKISKDGKPTAALICRIIFLVFTIYNMTVLPIPIWFWVLGILVWTLVLAGYKLALNKNK
ncbi:hypothetical protein NAL32_12605 [Chryseobacterium sp. Ch-15]|uniref:Uncharacterized protein n=1 Tax=Chryseobacterium muglaense TaxID=2893752 RepID=A0A9Q3V0D4_9FLAO|nr:hypothetical protein [Chryseobacterium muglaense]MBD3905360.1 hypothetical protein [Chryseobacterium muglaense]MCC9036915.1 hypothetical protein [Chryseobacterium muglaense]MCM2555223.1 hypothetical protein [Chryseobacterium muglaense]